MEESLQNDAPQSADDITAALREQRERARTFLSNWRGSSEGLGQKLIAQLEATARDLATIVDTDANQSEDFAQRQAELATQLQRLTELREEVTDREARLSHLQEQFLGQNQAQLTKWDEQAALLDEQREALRRREEQLQSQSNQSLQSQASLDQRFEQLQSLLTQLDEHSRESREAESQLAAARYEQQSAAEKLEQQRIELEQRRRSIEETAAQLATREKHLDELEQRSRASRVQLARELKVRRKEQLAEIERRRIELEQIVASEDEALESKLAGFQEELSRLQLQTDQRTSQVEDLRAQLDAAHLQLKQREAENRELVNRLEEIATTDKRNSVEAAEVAAQLAEAQEKSESQQAATQAALAKARDEQQQLRDALQASADALEQANGRIAELDQQAAALREQVDASGDEASKQRISELEAERDALVERLSDAETMAGHSGRASSEELSELQRRYEVALADLREAKLQNARLEDQVTSGGGVPVVAGGAMDWETQKRMMLAKLEADFDEDDPDQAADRMTVEGAISLTDQVVAEKERELEELRRLLDDQSQNLGGVAVGAAAIAEMLDGDDLIQQEREKLETLQQEWREKLRKAEIDISVERAKIARERAQMEEKLQSIAQKTITDDNGNESSGDTPKRGKWLARLGLGDSQ
jgi:chromosome segregation ATPase